MVPNLIPANGCTQYPQTGFLLMQNPDMDISVIISTNLQRWMDSRDDRDTIEKVAAAAGIGFGTVQRAKNGGNTTARNLERIAKAFRRTARDLVTPPDEVTIDTYSTVSRLGTSRLESVSTYGLNDVELLVVQGYRAASKELQELIQDMARRALKKKRD